MERHRWTQERRRKLPSLYDEYMTGERRATEPSDTSIRTHEPSTIRAVTPDYAADEGSLVQPKTTKTFERDFLGLSSSPVAPSMMPVQQSAEQPSSSRRKGSSGDPEDSARREATSSQAPRTRRRAATNERKGSDTSTPDSSTPRNRPRQGSAQLPPRPRLAGRSGSNGHPDLPSSFSQPILSASKSATRDQPSSQTLPYQRVRGAPPLPTPNSRRIVHLMKTLSGRYSGNASYRRSDHGSWKMAHCIINEAEGALICEAEFGTGSQKVLVPDLRGCEIQCLTDSSSGVPFLSIAEPQSFSSIHLRIVTASDLDSWYAALLCWQAMRRPPTKADSENPGPKSPPGGDSKTLSPQETPQESDSRQNSHGSSLKEAPVIKVGQMVFWDAAITYKAPEVSKSSSRPTMTRQSSYKGAKQLGERWWRRVSAQLRENGELRFFTDAENTILSTLQLSHLSRSAVQRLDSSVLDHDYCLAIYPQYTATSRTAKQVRPILLSLETSILHEVWFVLLRAFTIPQLYGPASARFSDADTVVSPAGEDKHLDADVFRMERGLSIAIIEAKFFGHERTKASPDPSSFSSRHGSSPKQGVQNGYYVEIHLDGRLRGKTQIREHETNPFWSHEFEYADLPPVLLSATLVIKQQITDAGFNHKHNHDSKHNSEAQKAVDDPYLSGAPSGCVSTMHDQTVGKVEITLDELETQKRGDSWWPISDSMDKEVGSLLIRARAEETIILMQKEYEPLNKLLHAFETGLTLQIFHAIPGELKRLSDALVNVFQVSGRSVEWLMVLVEDEIDGPSKETPLTKARYNQRLVNVDYDGTGARANDRELVVRDMNKTAAVEANLLFRGNTLLTKALDTHMRRVGSEYLVTALGTVISNINDRDPECEVDPSKVSSYHDIQKNLSRLMAATGDVWNSIRTSANKCPVELRLIFRHIKACAEDRYGDFLRTVSFSSVSGFLFLRFFCPAVLSPKLFGLLKDDPKPRAKRTFVLVAKSLQTLANLATFGSKEPWMEPMNTFLNSNREAFKRFIDEVCYVLPPPATLAPINPSYFTPTTIKNRLPAQNREGFPSLPFLLDEGRVYATLVDLWLHATRNNSLVPGTASESGNTTLLQFHELCQGLQRRTSDCFARAERADRPASQLSSRWEDANVASGTAMSSPSATADMPTLANTTPMSQGVTWVGDVVSPMARYNVPVFGERQSSLAASSPSTSPQPRNNANIDEWLTPVEANSVATATAAVSILSQDRNPRSGFVLPSTSTSSAAVPIPIRSAQDHPSPALTSTSSPGRSTDDLIRANNRGVSRNASLSVSTDHRSPSILAASTIGRPGSASPAIGTPISQTVSGGYSSMTTGSAWGVPPPPRPLTRTLPGHGGGAASATDDSSRPASAMSGKASLRSGGITSDAEREGSLAGLSGAEGAKTLKEKKDKGKHRKLRKADDRDRDRDKDKEKKPEGEMHRVFGALSGRRK